MSDIVRDAGISRVTWFRWVRSGLAPKPVPNLPGHPRWRASEIAHFLDGLIFPKPPNGKSYPVEFPFNFKAIK